MSRRAATFAALVALVLAAACSGDDSKSGESSASTTTAGPSSTATTTTAAPAEVTPLEGRPAAIAFSAGSLWIADDERNVVLRLDRADGRQLGEPIPVSARPVAVAGEDSWLWVAGALGEIARIDVNSNLINLSNSLGGAFADVIVDSGVVMVADIENNSLRQLYAPTADPVVSSSVSQGVVRIAVGADRIWVTNLDNTVTPIDLTTGTVGVPIEVGNGPIGLALAGSVLWVANSDDHTVSRIDTVTNKPLGDPITVGKAPIDVAVSADGNDVWVLNQESQSLTRLRASDGSVVGDPISLGTRPRGMVVTPEGVWVVGVEPSAAVFVKTS